MKTAIIIAIIFLAMYLGSTFQPFEKKDMPIQEVQKNVKKHRSRHW